MLTTRVSSKGQLVLPKEVRERLGWRKGTELEVVEQPGGVLLRFPRRRVTTVDELMGCLKYDGPPKTLEDMEKGIEAAVLEENGWLREPRG